MHQKWLEQYPLFKECIEALKITILPKTESNKASEVFEKLFPLTDWGKIDWNKIDKKIFAGYDQNNIIPALEQLLNRTLTKKDKDVYIEWSDGGAPAIKAYLDDVIEFFDDVICVAFEKFMFNPMLGYIIEVKSGGEITAGLVKPYNQIIDVVDANYIQHVKHFLQKLEHLSVQEVPLKLDAIKKEVNTLIQKIKSCDQAYEAQTYFSLLGKFKDLLKIYFYKEHIHIPDSLKKFIKDFNRIDLQEIREKVFSELKKNIIEH